MNGLLDTADYVLFESAVFLFLIAVWGFWKYRERELLHKEAVLNVGENLPQGTRARAGWMRIVTTVAVFAILLLAVIRGYVLVLKMVSFFDNPLAYLAYPVLVELSLVAVLFLAMIVRDIRSLVMKG